MGFQIKRVYEAAVPGDGLRVLVDRLWPRGVSKERAKLDAWMKEIAPSAELREWFGHLPERYPAFREKYRAELQTDPTRQADAQKLLQLARGNTVTLLYGAKNPDINDAVVLMEYLKELEE